MSEYLAYCLVSISPVRSAKADQSEIVTQLLFGELVAVEELDHPWAKITTHSDGYQGFIDHKHIRKLTEKEFKRWTDSYVYLKDRERTVITPWGKQRICRGTYVGTEKSFNIGNDQFEFIDSPAQEFSTIQEYAEDYLNTPYLWGGKSPYGIDCSGITQVIYRLFDFNLPRDASEQVLHGRSIEFSEIEAGDLAYFDKNGRVTHVGILDGKGNIIHAAGHVRKDIFTEEGIINNNTKELTHNLFSIKRL